MPQLGYYGFKQASQTVVPFVEVFLCVSRWNMIIHSIASSENFFVWIRNPSLYSLCDETLIMDIV